MIAKLPRAEVSSGWAHSLKILIVDDDQKTRVLLKTFLENNQYEVMVAHEGAGFLAEFAAHSVQLCLVILGVMLPDMDGFALCRSSPQMRMRQTASSASKQPALIKTVRGSGCVFAADVSASDA